MDQQLDLYIYDPGGQGQEQLALDKSGIQKIEKLLQAGANPNYQNEWGRNLVYEALSAYNVELLELAIKFGADVNLHHIRKRVASQAKTLDILFRWAFESKSGRGGAGI